MNKDLQVLSKLPIGAAMSYCKMHGIRTDFSWHPDTATIEKYGYFSNGNRNALKDKSDKATPTKSPEGSKASTTTKNRRRKRKKKR